MIWLNLFVPALIIVLMLTGALVAKQGMSWRCLLGFHKFKPAGIHSYACTRCPAVEAGYP